MDSEDFFFDYSENDTIEIAKRLCGDFSTLNVESDWTTEKKIEACNEYYYQIKFFIGSYFYNLGNIHLCQLETTTSIYGARSSELFISVEKNNYQGLDVLAHLEKLNDDLYYAGSKGENYQKVALECYNYIELIYSNESEFNMMYPMIQLLVAKEAESTLGVMIAYTNPNRRMTPEYTLAEMLNKCVHYNIYEVRENVMELLMSYIKTIE